MTERGSIGQTLRSGREERGLTPEQAAFQSKVPLRLLQALEADDYRLLPDAAYLLRFLHEYARLLKLDPSVLEVEFRQAIRRPVGTSLALAPATAPPPPIPWKQLLWTAAAILVITPLVFIALSLASKRAAHRPVPAPVNERVVEEPAPLGERFAEEPVPGDGEGSALVERFLTWSPETGHPEGAPPQDETPAHLSKSQEPPAPAPVAVPAAPREVRPSRRYLLTAHALEPTWMAVRADGGQERQVLLQKGQTARFVSDAGFVVTVGNAGGVDLRLNGQVVPALGASGQVVRNLAIPPGRGQAAAPGPAEPLSIDPGGDTVRR